MAIFKPEQQRDRRFEPRATVAEEELIRAAADRYGVNLSEFILRSARMAALDRPAKDKLGLRKLFQEQHVAKRRP